ncbi:MAG: 1-phosphofructokinase family hexose kinase [Trueperaceae bacterium]|nr:1-phosphofructokinase family hexose kinase [Trueperaceae bacterium]
MNTNAQTSRILSLTMNPSVDESSRTDRVVPDDKLRCSAPEREPGGGGINVSRAVAKLGGSAPAFFTAGGPPGEVLQTLLAAEGLERHPLAVDGWTRSNLTVLEESAEQQFRFVFPGAALAETEWQRCLGELEDQHTNYLVASGSLPPGVPEDFYARLAERSAERGVKLIVDTSGAPLEHAARAGVYLLKPNIRELQQLAGASVEDEEGLEHFAYRLVARGACDVLVVSLGAGGALLVTDDSHHYVRSPTVPIKSKVGAGDSMVGGIVLGLARGLSVLEAVRFGVAAGAAAVMTPGTELCRREDTEQLYTRTRQEQD